MSMTMSMSTSASAASATTTAMSHSMGGSTCKISMLWNWTTVDACFISRDWHIRSTAAYVGSVFAIFFLVILLEAFRRMAREYDRRIVREHAMKSQNSSGSDLKGDLEGATCPAPPFAPNWKQQLLRSTFYFVQFGAGYMLMLLAMYYNGGIIAAIFFGAYAGHFISARDTVGNAAVISKDCCC